MSGNDTGAPTGVSILKSNASSSSFSGAVTGQGECVVRVDRESSCNKESCSLMFGEHKIIKGIIGKTRATLIAAEYNSSLAIVEQRLELANNLVRGHIGAWNDLALLLDVKCWPIQQPRFVSEAVAALLQRAKELQDWQKDVQEREGACCPEDRGFDEVIRDLRKRLEEASAADSVSDLPKRSDASGVSTPKLPSSLEAEEQRLKEKDFHG